MVTEVAILKIEPEKANSFESMFGEVAPVISRQPGHRINKLMRSIENPDTYILIVEWDRVESHKNFMKSKDYSLVAEGFDKFVIESTFAHYNTVAEFR